MGNSGILSHRVITIFAIFSSTTATYQPLHPPDSRVREKLSGWLTLSYIGDYSQMALENVILSTVYIFYTFEITTF